MKINLKVPFAEKDQAKQLGARWDAARKTWYIEGKDDISPFARWSPSPHDGAAPPPNAAPARRQVASRVQTGVNYVEHPRVCDCAPWEVCDACRPFALSGGELVKKS